MEYDASLWVTDGTGTGTVMVKDDNAAPSTNRNRFAGMTAMGGALYFAYLNVDDSGNPSGTGPLWKSEGTASTTHLFKEGNIDTENIIAVGSTLYFWIDSTLWKTNGTQSGTVRVKQFSSSQYIMDSTSEGGLLYFKRDNYDTSKKEFWVSDGTEDGTIKLLEVSQGGEG